MSSDGDPWSCDMRNCIVDSEGNDLILSSVDSQEDVSKNPMVNFTVYAITVSSILLG